MENNLYSRAKAREATGPLVVRWKWPAADSARLCTHTTPVLVDRQAAYNGRGWESDSPALMPDTLDCPFTQGEGEKQTHTIVHWKDWDGFRRLGVLGQHWLGKESVQGRGGSGSRLVHNVDQWLIPRVLMLMAQDPAPSDELLLGLRILSDLSERCLATSSHAGPQKLTACPVYFALTWCGTVRVHRAETWATGVGWEATLATHTCDV